MRWVSVQKVVVSEDHSKVSLGKVYEGWEEITPTVGESYLIRIFSDSGAIYKTSAVVNINGDFIDRNPSHCSTSQCRPYDSSRGKITCHALDKE